MEILVGLLVISMVSIIIMLFRRDKKLSQQLAGVSKNQDKKKEANESSENEVAATENVDFEKMSLTELGEQSAFVAFDFETANEELSSACALGLAFSDGLKVVTTRHYLIKPTPNRFEAQNIEIHGITPEMVAGAPTFDKINEILIQLRDATFVAHNLEFDATVWREAFIATLPTDSKPAGELDEFDKKQLIYRLADLPITAGCTLKLSRKIYPGLGKYALDNVCANIGYCLKNHHNAAADAVAAATIMNDMIEQYGVASCVCPVVSLYDELGYEYAEDIEHQKWMKPFGKARKFSGGKIHAPISSATLASPDLGAIENKDTPFFAKKVVITGTFENYAREELALKLKALGSDIQGSLSKNVDYLVVGKDPGWSKMAKAKEYVDGGGKLVILNEDSDILSFHLKKA